MMTHSSFRDAAPAAGPLGARLLPLAPAAIAVLRIGAGLLFMQHGAQKLLGLFGGFGGTPGATAPLFSQMGLAGVLELVGGLLIVIGLLTRPVAIVLAGEMLVAYLIAHAPRSPAPIENGGEHTLLFLLVFLALAVLGAGAFSADRLLARRRRR